jgi:murein DD-endopeptidase MepM/ murein hydrolase activator NlpD
MGIVSIDNLLNQFIGMISQQEAPSASKSPQDESSLWKWLSSIRKDEPSQSPAKALPSAQPNGPMPSTGFQSPIRGTYYNSGNFGHGDARHGGVHNGVDLRASGGTPVYPFMDGVVTFVGTSGKGGNNVRIQHDGGFRTYYAHLGTILVQKGDQVTKTTQIGTVGNSGNAVGGPPHLHFELSKDGTLQDPAKYIYVPKYSDIQPEEKEWLSDAHKRNADTFRYRAASTENVGRLEKLADKYYKLAIKL